MYPKPPYPKVSVIMCTLDEEKNLPHVMPRIPSWVDELLLVDGYSTDRTVEVAKQLKPDVNVLYQLGRGKGNALKYGIRHATGDIVVTLDADGATDPLEMSRFIEALLKGYDFAKGTRLTHNRPKDMPWHRWLGNKILALTASILFGVRYTDICSGYNAFWRKVFLKMPLMSEGFEMEQELNAKVAKLRYKIVEVPHTHARRLHGVSKTRDLKQGVKDLMIMLMERFRRD